MLFLEKVWRRDGRLPQDSAADMIAGCIKFVYHHFMVMNSITVQVLGTLKLTSVSVDCNRNTIYSEPVPRLVYSFKSFQPSSCNKILYPQCTRSRSCCCDWWLLQLIENASGGFAFLEHTLASTAAQGWPMEPIDRRYHQSSFCLFMLKSYNFEICLYLALEV